MVGNYVSDYLTFMGQRYLSLETPAQRIVSRKRKHGTLKICSEFVILLFRT